MSSIVVLFCVAFLFAHSINATFPLQNLDSRSEVEDFNWSSIPPAKDLVYHDCYGEFKCARLILPLDWKASNNSLYDKTAVIAIAKFPAKVPITSSTYGGGILINPGGPGGSGVLFARDNAQFLQHAFDSDNKHFDIIGFDPRGVYESRPAANCFRNPLLRDLWNQQLSDEGSLDQGDMVINMKWARSHALGRECATSDFGKYVSTASVARDMLAITEKMEERYSQEVVLSDSKRSLTENVAEDGGEHVSKLLYYGGSYGTMLGNTFASLFPDRVGRMVLDAVVDAPDYTSESWKRNLLDTDELLERLYQLCFNAGRLRCALYNPQGPKAIANDVDSILQSLKQSPIGLSDGSGSPALLTYSSVKTLIFQSIYTPGVGFVQAVSILAMIRDRKFAKLTPDFQSQPVVQCPKGGTFKPSDDNEASMAIMCGDGDIVNDQTKPEFKRYLSFLESQSSTSGAIWAALRIGCIGWLTRPTWRFTGPFGGKTSNPILWMDSSLDPVTPIANAFKMAKLFPGSGVLVQASEGHSALFNYPSNCTLNAVRQYFNTAKLPKPGTICQPVAHAFEKKGSMARYGGSLNPPRWRFPLAVGNL